MVLNKKETQKSKQTVIIQPIVKEKESGSTTTPVTPTTTQKLNRRGEPYIKGKHLAAAFVSALPMAGCALSALGNAVDANHKIKKENLKGNLQSMAKK